MDDTHVYWTTWAGQTVMRGSKSGGSVEILVGNLASNADIAVDDTHIYWAAGTQVLRLSKCGCDL